MHWVSEISYRMSCSAQNSCSTMAFVVWLSGFLSTMTNEVPGNAGALDALLALQWVKDNIKQFNGDPNQITVFSQSSGSVMASAIAISPLTPKDLFQRLIIQSASVLVPWAYALDPATYSRDIARRVTPSLVNASLSDLNAAFMQMSVVDLLQASEASYVRVMNKCTTASLFQLE